jgi:hypothetical protein
VAAGSGRFSNNYGTELSINGQRARSNNYQLDGQNTDNTIGGLNFFFGNSPESHGVATEHAGSGGSGSF